MNDVSGICQYIYAWMSKLFSNLSDVNESKKQLNALNISSPIESFVYA